MQNAEITFVLTGPPGPAGDPTVFFATKQEAVDGVSNIKIISPLTLDFVLDTRFGNVDNTHDVDKPISDDTQQALDTKASQFEVNDHETRLDALELSESAGIGLVAANWLELAAVTPSDDKTGAWVLPTDTGTHTDPVVGGTVPNAGIYQYHASAPVGWKRLGPYTPVPLTAPPWLPLAPIVIERGISGAADVVYLPNFRGFSGAAAVDTQSTISVTREADDTTTRTEYEFFYKKITGFSTGGPRGTILVLDHAALVAGSDPFTETDLVNTTSAITLDATKPEILRTLVQTDGNTAYVSLNGVPLLGAVPNGSVPNLSPMGKADFNRAARLGADTEIVNVLDADAVAAGMTQGVRSPTGPAPGGAYVSVGFNLPEPMPPGKYAIFVCAAVTDTAGVFPDINGQIVTRNVSQSAPLKLLQKVSTTFAYFWGYRRMVGSDTDSWVTGLNVLQAGKGANLTLGLIQGHYGAEKPMWIMRDDYQFALPDGVLIDDVWHFIDGRPRAIFTKQVLESRDGEPEHNGTLEWLSADGWNGGVEHLYQNPWIDGARVNGTGKFTTRVRRAPDLRKVKPLTIKHAPISAIVGPIYQHDIGDSLTESTGHPVFLARRLGEIVGFGNVFPRGTVTAKNYDGTKTVNAEGRTGKMASDYTGESAAYTSVTGLAGAGLGDIDAAGYTVTITIASPAVITEANHGLAVGQAIKYTTTGALPTGITAGATYYVSSILTTNTYKISATLGGSSVNTSGTQSGVHTRHNLVATWADYIALDQSTRKQTNPYRRPTIAGDNPSFVFGGKIFDPAWYHTNNAWVNDLTHININLGTNDLGNLAFPPDVSYDGSVAIAVRSCDIIYRMFRARYPTAIITLATNALPFATFHGFEDSFKWNQRQVPFIKALMAKVGTYRSPQSIAAAMTIASPGLVTDLGHGFAVGQPVQFTTTGALLTGLTPSTTYYVSYVVSVNTYRVSATRGGASINFTGTQSGTHTRVTVPDLKVFMVGMHQFVSQEGGDELSTVSIDAQSGCITANVTAYGVLHKMDALANQYVEALLALYACEA